MQSRQLLVGTLCKCKVYIKQHPILSSEKCLGLAGRAEIITKLSTDGSNCLYQCIAKSVPLGKSAQRKQIKIKLGLST